MAYNKKRLFEQAKEAIIKNNLFFVEDIVAFLPCEKPTFYDKFPPNSNEFNTLKGLLETNKIRTKSAIRAKLFKSEKAGELLALYRLVCTSDERRLLNQNYLEVTGKDGKALQQQIMVEVIDRREQVDTSNQEYEDTDDTDIH